MVDGVEVIPVLHMAGGEKRLVLVKQFRIPINAFCIEFPAGLIDPEESVSGKASVVVSTAWLSSLKSSVAFLGTGTNSGIYVDDNL